MLPLPGITESRIGPVVQTSSLVSSTVALPACNPFDFVSLTEFGGALCVVFVDGSAPRLLSFSEPAARLETSLRGLFDCGFDEVGVPARLRPVDRVGLSAGMAAK